MADMIPNNNNAGGLSNIFTSIQNVAKAIGQLNQSLTTVIQTLANTWTALQTFSAGINTASVATSANLVLGNGSALTLSATTGWVEIPSCAGTPTGVPANAAVGKIAIVYDTTGHKIWVYDPLTTTWKGVAVA